VNTFFACFFGKPWYQCNHSKSLLKYIIEKFTTIANYYGFYGVGGLI